jgi:serine/threonine protein phosphatase PrpC
MRNPGSISGQAERTPRTGTSWQLIGGSVRGAAHIRANKPNQDAIAWKPLGAATTTGAAGEGVLEARAMVAALADGHGGDRHPRSDRGAQLAVEATLMVLDKFVAGQRGRAPSAVLRAARRTVPRLISRRWRKLIDREAGDEPGGEQRYLPYGATILAVAVTERYLLYLQLGDGDILAVLADGSVRRPIAPDPAQGSTRETSSLCQEICDGLFRFAMQPLVETGAPELPTMLLLATDGYSNSFEDAEGLVTAARDIQDKADAHSLEQVRERLDGWLQETSHAGSGDDITVAVLRRVNAADAPVMAGTASGVAQAGPGERAARPMPPPLPPPQTIYAAAELVEEALDPSPLPGPEQNTASVPAPGSPEQLRRRMVRLQWGLGASLGLWVITLVAGLATIASRRDTPPKSPAPAVAVARNQGPMPAPARPQPAGMPAPPATVPPSGPAPAAAAGSPAQLAMAPARKRSRIAKKKRSRALRLARLNRRAKNASAAPAARAAAPAATPAKPVLRARKPRNRG